MQNEETHLGQRIFNVTRAEWSRVLHAWGLRFFFQMGYVIGWTLITAMVVTHFGIQGLPFFYILNGALIILGTYVFSYLISQFSLRRLILCTAGCAALLLALSLIFFNENKHLFVMALILTISVFSSQLYILLLSYIEELFSPLESERVSPLIETAEPLGGVAAGLCFVFLVGILKPEGFVFLWVLALCALLPLYYGLRYVRRRLPVLHIKEHHQGERSLGKGMGYVKIVPFVKLLLVVILLQWMFANLMEYQYTNAINASISHTLQESVGGAKPLAHAAELTHGLGTFHLVFSLLMFFVQLLLSARIVNRLGVVRSMMLLPGINLLNSVLLFFQFGLGTAVWTKGAYEVLLVVYNNGYHSSYYAFYEGVREQIREVLEGGIRSLGVIVGTALIIVVQVWAPLSLVPKFLAIAMMVLSIVMLMLLWHMRKLYTHVSKKNLEYVGAHPEKFNAIEILTQKGHFEAEDILTKCLMYKNEPPAVKIKILDALGRIGDIRALPDILTMLRDPDEGVKIAALDAIGSFKHLGEHFYSQAFAKHRVIDALSELFEGKQSLPVRSAIVRAFAGIRHPEVVSLLLKSLDTPDEQLRSNVIFIIGMFKDPSTGFYLEKFLDDPFPKARANALIALWQFKKYRLKLLSPLLSMVESKEKEMLKSGIFALGEIGAVQEIPRLLGFLDHEDEDIRRYAAVSLMKLEHPDAVSHVTKFLLHPDRKTGMRTKAILQGLPTHMGKILRASLLQEIQQLLRARFGEARHILLEELSADEVAELQYYYELLGEHSEMAKIHYVRHQAAV